ncbi:MAG: tetratricopeptide repeat protein [Calothrix sp. SM1_5_4]|nr:tetratricopeptide repeat protein [Calothrix sp. SM1_5_4]
MRVIILILSILLSFGCTTINRESRERATLHMQIGTGFLSQGQYPQAMSELLKAERLDPDNPAILNNLGLAYYVRGRWAQAEQKFERAITKAPNFSDAKNNLARVFIDRERFIDAIKILREVEGDLTYPFPEKTYSNLGMAYFLSGHYQKAEEYLAKSLQIRRQSCTTANYYGRTLLEMKRIQQSAEVLDQAVEFCRPTKFEDPLYFSAMSYFSLGEKEKSRARLEELLKEYPKSKYVAKAKGMLELLAQ